MNEHPGNFYVKVLMAVSLVKPVSLKSELRDFRLTQRGSENGKGFLRSLS